MAGHGGTLGRVGTVARGAIGIGLLVIAVTTQHLSWWDVAAAVLVLPALTVATAAAVNQLIGRTSIARKARTSWSPARIAAALVIIVVVLGVGIALTYVSPIDGGALYAFFGLSMVIAAVKGFDGCEILALPNLVSLAPMPSGARSTPPSTPPNPRALRQTRPDREHRPARTSHHHPDHKGRLAATTSPKQGALGIDNRKDLLLLAELDQTRAKPLHEVAGEA